MIKGLPNIGDYGSIFVIPKPVEQSATIRRRACQQEYLSDQQFWWKSVCRWQQVICPQGKRTRAVLLGVFYWIPPRKTQWVGV